MSKFNKDDKNYNFALFKFSLIAPLVNDSYLEPSKSAFFRNVSAKTHYFEGKPMRVSVATLKNWYNRYNKDGFESLVHKQRSDKGESRVLDLSTKSRTLEILDEFPHITAVSVYDILLEEGVLNKHLVSLSTVSRFIRYNRIKPNRDTLERRAYEHQNPNDMWQADTSVGPYIVINGKTTKTYLIMFIDDSSRVVTGFSFFIADNAVNMQYVFRDSISKFGLPKKLYVDNGSPYKNEQLSLICASLGVILIHSKPYSPQGKGKIERMFRTIKDGWMRRVNWKDFSCLDDINKSLFSFISSYHHRKHSSLKGCPLDKFHTLENIKYLEPAKLNSAFLHTFTRKVKGDSTISINCTQFEVPSIFIGNRISVRHAPLDMSKAYIFHNDEIITISPVKKVDNSKIKRLNYGDIYDD